MDSRQMEWSRIHFSSSAAQQALQAADVSESSIKNAVPLSVQTNLDLASNEDAGASANSSSYLACLIAVNVVGGLLAVGAIVTGVLWKKQDGEQSKQDGEEAV